MQQRHCVHNNLYKSIKNLQESCWSCIVIVPYLSVTRAMKKQDVCFREPGECELRGMAPLLSSIKGDTDDLIGGSDLSPLIFQHCKQVYPTGNHVMLLFVFHRHQGITRMKPVGKTTAMKPQTWNELHPLVNHIRVEYPVEAQMWKFVSSFVGGAEFFYSQ